MSCNQQQVYSLRDIRADIAGRNLRADYIVCIEDKDMNILTFTTCFRENTAVAVDAMKRMIRANLMTSCDVTMYPARLREK